MRLDTHRPRTPYAVLAVFALLASAFVALSVAGPANAKSDCGRKVLEDWYDNGRVDKLYPLHCYEDAIDQIPKDLGPYVDAEEVISRALQSALGGRLAPGGCDPTPDGSPDDCREPGSPSGGGNVNGGGGGSGTPNPGGGPEAAPEIDPSGASSVPVPLLVLGGMSVALLAAGGLGYLSRRRLGVESVDPTDDFPA